MRIRTIKPAFWANEKMSVMPDFTRLLAIGLLNYSDDYGYFWANPLLVRGALFPFDEDSTKIRRGLAQLASEGFVKLGKTSDGRECGFVVNFTKHQRVDRPQDSEIKPIAVFDEDSTKDRGSIGDESSLYRKGMEGKGKEVSSRPNSASSEENSPELPLDKTPTEADRFVDWFLRLLVETGTPQPKLTQGNRDSWADCYDKLLRLDGRTKEQVKEVCQWARNDNFWKSNFMSPMKLREKKDGISYFDSFANKMKNGNGTNHQPAVAVCAEPSNLRGYLK